MKQVKGSAAGIAMVVLCIVQLAGCDQHAMVTSLGDLRSERRISESDAFYFQEIVTLDGTNPTQQVGRPIHYGKPYVGLPSQVIGDVLHLVWPLWASNDLGPSTAFPIEIGNSKAPDQPHTYIRTVTYASPGRPVVREIASLIDQIQVESLALADLRIQLAQAQYADKGKTQAQSNGKTNQLNGMTSMQSQPGQADTSDQAETGQPDAQSESADGESDQSDAANKDKTADGDKTDQKDNNNKKTEQSTDTPAQTSPTNPITDLRNKIEQRRNNIATLRKTLHNLLNGKDKDGNPIADTGNSNGAVDPNTTGVMIVRWAAEGSGGFNADAGDILSAGTQGSHRRSGYVILGGIRVSQLVLGSDLYREIVDDYTWREGSNEDTPRQEMQNSVDRAKIIQELLQHESLGITMYTLKAKDIAYASDLQADFSAQLMAAFDKSGVKALKSIDSVTIRAELAQATDFSNIGALSNPTWDTQPIQFHTRMLPADIGKLKKDRDDLERRVKQLQNNLESSRESIQNDQKLADDTSKFMQLFNDYTQTSKQYEDAQRDYQHAMRAMSGNNVPEDQTEDAGGDNQGLRAGPRDGADHDNTYKTWSTIYSVVGIPKKIQLDIAKNILKKKDNP